MLTTRRQICVILAAFLFASPLTAAEKLKVLLIDGQNNHRWQQTTPVLKKALEDTGRFTVTVSTTPPAHKPASAWDAWRPDFAQYDVVVSNYNGELWPKPVCDAFVKYVRDGGGFVSVHAADNAFSHWPEYNEMIGVGGWGSRNQKAGPHVYVKDGKIVRDTSPGNAGSHGRRDPFRLTAFTPDHPIMQGLPHQWMHAGDELYCKLRGPAEHMTILATADSPVSHCTEPILMAIDFGKGRVFHDAMGHDVNAMNCVGFRFTLARGTEWAATGKVTLPVPANFPGPDKVVPAE